jgi:hypothetical protein
MTSAHATDAPGTDIVVPLRSRKQKRVAAVQKVNHLIPASALMLGGVQSLRDGAHGLELALAVGGIATSALLLVAFARHVNELRKPSSGHGAHGIDWMDIWAAGVLFAEGVEKYRIRGHLWRPEFLATAATLFVGIFHGRFAAAGDRRRSLRVAADHLYIGGKLRFSRPLNLRWDEIAEIVMTEREATVRTRAGRTRRLNLADVEEAPRVRAALQQAQRRVADHARLEGAPSPVAITP